MLDMINQGLHQRLCQAKGLKRSAIVLKSMRSEMLLIPIITIAGSQLGDILTGSIIVSRSLI